MMQISQKAAAFPFQAFAFLPTKFTRKLFNFDQIYPNNYKIPNANFINLEDSVSNELNGITTQ
jgi:hypothetical protein